MIAYDRTWALIVVDTQNDFADPSGELPVAGGADIVPFVNAEIRRARAGGALVAYTQDWHPDHTPHFLIDGGIWPVHCVMDTWGAEFHPDLDVDGPVVRKGSNGEDGYSGFTMRDPVTGVTRPTNLDNLVRAAGAQHVAICGLATDYCVKATAMDALILGYETVVLQDGIRAVNLQPNDGREAIAAMREAGATIEPDSEDGDQ